MKPKLWRVRAIVKSEMWIELLATSALEAEIITATKPGVVSVMPGMTVPADKPARGVTAGVQDDEDDG